MSGNRPVDVALALAENLGWHVAPIGPAGEQLATPTSEADAIRYAWQVHPDAGLAVACGLASGVLAIVLEPVDEPAAAEARATWLGTLPATARARHDDGTETVLFRHPGAEWKVPRGESRPAPGVRVLSEGARAALPPTPGWTWTEGSRPSQVGIAPVPMALMARIVPPAAPPRQPDPPRPAPPRPPARETARPADETSPGAETPSLESETGPTRETASPATETPDPELKTSRIDRGTDPGRETSRLDRETPDPEPPRRGPPPAQAPRRLSEATSHDRERAQLAAASLDGRRLPPQNLEAEVGILGAALLDQDAIARVRQIVGPEDFYRDAHRRIWEAMLELDQAGESVDLIGLAQHLRTAGRLEQVGGESALSKIEDSVATTAHVESHARIVVELAAQRRAIEVATELLTRGYEGGADTEELLTETRRVLGRIQRGLSATKPAPKPRRKPADEPEREDLDEDLPPERPTIVIRPALSEVTDEAEKAILANPRANLYVRSRLLVRVVRDGAREIPGVERPPGAPTIEPIATPALRELLDRSARWVRSLKKGDDKEALPPEWVAPTLAAREDWAFPYLNGVVEAPTLRADGSVLDEPGHDQASGLLLDQKGTFPPVPDAPTGQDVEGAAAALLEPFQDFPFTAPADQAAAVAAILSLIGRYAIKGPVPMFAVRAPTPGSGKTLLADVISIVGTGRPAARTASPKEPEETRKRILATALAGTPSILIDNAVGSLGDHALAMALTADEIEERLLGVNKMVRAPLKTIWFVTGNGLSFKGDLRRRIVPIDLDPRCENPEDRTGFRHEALLAYVTSVRPCLVVSALTILHGYFAASRPRHGKSRVGSYEAWDDLVRGACIWAGLADPADGRERLREDGDADLEALRAVLGALYEVFGERPWTIAEAVARAEKDADLKAALVTFAPPRSGLTPEARSLGYAIRTRRGRIAGGKSIEKAGSSHNSVALWRVRTESSPVMSLFQSGGGDGGYGGDNSRLTRGVFSEVDKGSEKHGSVELESSPPLPLSPPDGDDDDGGWEEL